jgi:hypothetical protein
LFPTRSLPAAGIGANDGDVWVQLSLTQSKKEGFVNTGFGGRRRMKFVESLPGLKILFLDVLGEAHQENVSGSSFHSQMNLRKLLSPFRNEISASVATI